LRQGGVEIKVKGEGASLIKPRGERPGKVNPCLGKGPKKKA